jgi:hypothetical protein
LSLLSVQLVSITTNVNPAHCEVYSIQHYVIKFVSDLQQVGGFLRVLRFPPSIKLPGERVLLKTYFLYLPVLRQQHKHAVDYLIFFFFFLLIFNYPKKHSTCQYTSEVYSIQHYVIKFVSDLQQVGGFLRVLRFPPSIKLTAVI